MPIFAAIDRSERSEYVIREAAELARAFDETVYAIHVLSTREFIELERTNVEDKDRALEMDAVRKVAADIAEEAVSNIAVEYESVGLVGDVADEIVEYAAERNANYIVISPRKRSPTGKAIFGSTAQKVIVNADCPVVSTTK